MILRWDGGFNGCFKKTSQNQTWWWKEISLSSTNANYLGRFWHFVMELGMCLASYLGNLDYKVIQKVLIFK